MSSRRNLKKDINYLTFELLNECFIFQHFHKDMKSEFVDEVVGKILDNRNELVSRINHVNGKDDPKLVKEQFKKIRADFDKSIDLLESLDKAK